MKLFFYSVIRYHSEFFLRYGVRTPCFYGKFLSAQKGQRLLFRKKSVQLLFQGSRSPSSYVYGFCQAPGFSERIPGIFYLSHESLHILFLFLQPFRLEVKSRGICWGRKDSYIDAETSLRLFPARSADICRSLSATVLFLSLCWVKPPQLFLPRGSEEAYFRKAFISFTGLLLL